jgi:hypothetical protein
MEIIIATPLDNISPQFIKFNKAEIAAYLDDKLAKYRGRVFTDDEIGEAKQARALINKVEKAMNDEKIRVKKAFIAPYSVFESDVKELMEKCSEVSAEIDQQVKDYENQKKDEKKQKLTDYFIENIGRAKEYVVFDDIYDPKWMNVTVEEETAKEQIADYIERYQQDVEVLESIETDVPTKVVLERRYKETRSITEVLRLKKEIEEQAKREAELAARRAEQQRAAQVETQSAQNIVYKPATTSAIPDSAQTIPVYTTLTVKFQVTTTREKLSELKAFLVDNEINYQAIKD